MFWVLFSIRRGSDDDNITEKVSLGKRMSLRDVWMREKYAIELGTVFKSKINAHD